MADIEIRVATFVLRVRVPDSKRELTGWIITKPDLTRQLGEQLLAADVARPHSNEEILNFMLALVQDDQPLSISPGDGGPVDQSTVGDATESVIGLYELYRDRWNLGTNVAGILATYRINPARLETMTHRDLIHIGLSTSQAIDTRGSMERHRKE